MSHHSSTPFDDLKAGDLPQLGGTGEFPQGKLNEHDEGAINIAIGSRNGRVIIDLGAPTAWVGMLPAEAEDLARSLFKQARLSRPAVVPGTVSGAGAQRLYAHCNDVRRELKQVGALLNELRLQAGSEVAQGASPEVVANATLAYRHLEDASMRLGKALQALDGGVSVYDKETTIGAPSTPS